MKKAFFVFMFIAIMPWFIVGIPIYNTFQKEKHEKDYKKAVFEVEDLKYIPSYVSKGGHTHQTDIYADGVINGSKEKYILFGELDPDPTSQEELEKMVRIGQEFDVWYNPNMTRTIMQNENLRVLKYGSDTFEKVVKVRIQMLKFAITPMVGVLLVFGILFTIRMLKGTRKDPAETSENNYMREVNYCLFLIGIWFGIEFETRFISTPTLL